MQYRLVASLEHAISLAKRLEQSPTIAGCTAKQFFMMFDASHPFPFNIFLDTVTSRATRLFPRGNRCG